MAKEAGTYTIYFYCNGLLSPHLTHPSAATKALKDAGIPYSDVEQAVVGYVYGELIFACSLSLASRLICCQVIPRAAKELFMN